MNRALRLCLALGGFVAVAGLAWPAVRADGPPAAQATAVPASCPGCDARHANLRARQARLSEERE